MITPKYPFTIRELSTEDGGGYFIEFPDLPGCISDGETMEEAIINGTDAIEAWIAAAKEKGRAIPILNDLENLSGKWVQRVPRSLHAKLARQAKQEHVSLNTLVVSILAESVGFNDMPNSKKAKPIQCDVQLPLKSVKKSKNHILNKN